VTVDDAIFRKSLMKIIIGTYPKHRHQSGTLLSQETNRLHLVPMFFMRSILVQFSNSAGGRGPHPEPQADD
jgi:hypothetical protein